MPRLLILLLLAVTLPAFSQNRPLPATRPILKALPIGGDDDITSRPLPEESVNRPAPAPPAPAPATTPNTLGAVGSGLASNVTAAAATPPPAPTPVPALEPVLPEPATPIEADPEAVPSPLDVKPTGDDAIRLQIFLDEAYFGPGVIDGKPGRFTELAVRSWNEVHGHPIDDWTAVNAAARKAVPNPLAVAVVPETAKQWVDPSLPTKRSLQAKKKRMSYRSFGEFMAERYHCDVPFLITLNGSAKVYNLKPQDSLIVPNVTPFHIEKLSGARYEADEALSARHVVVDTKMNQARIFEAAPAALIVAEPGATEIQPVTRANRGLIASFPITPGQPKFIKFGTWELRNMIEMPHWRYDQQLLDTGKRSANALNIPPGPNSPVGVIWNGLSKPGIGMHGTSDPETIGRSRSAGCIRLANWDAIRLPDLIRPGTTVEIR
jgi:lipoprotein-anchoring transpeptidase ErfK/SrfK